MATDKTREKLSHLISEELSKWMEEAKWRKENKAWLKKSQAIALRVLRTLREKKMKQNELARVLGVSDQQISKIVKGKENLTLDTISKLEKALGVLLFELPRENKSEDASVSNHQSDVAFKSSKVHSFFEIRSSMSETVISTMAQYVTTAQLKQSSVTVAKAERRAHAADMMVYEPEEKNNYNEAA